MCRLFGFRSVTKSQVHRSLVSAENALGVQSLKHGDGWGVGYYLEGFPHLIRSSETALHDHIFQRVSGVVSSECVIAHIRKATQGTRNTLNSHPFQYGQYMFAHNGNVLGFSDRRPASPSACRRMRGKRAGRSITVRDFLASRCLPHFLRFVLGETDSELLFYLFLSHLERKATALNLPGGIHSPQITLDIMAEALLAMIDDVEEAVGDTFCRDSTQPGRDNTFLSVIVTNGRVLLAHQGGQKLFYSTHKNRCADRNVCPSFGESCEAPSKTGVVNHFIVSSEPLQGENVWTEIPPGTLVGVDERMRIRLLKWEDMVTLRAEERSEVVVRPHKHAVDRGKYAVGGCGNTGQVLEPDSAESSAATSKAGSELDLNSTVIPVVVDQTSGDTASADSARPSAESPVVSSESSPEPPTTVRSTIHPPTPPPSTPPPQRLTTPPPPMPTPPRQLSLNLLESRSLTSEPPAVSPSRDAGDLPTLHTTSPKPTHPNEYRLPYTSHAPLTPEDSEGDGGESSDGAAFGEQGQWDMLGGLPPALALRMRRQRRSSKGLVDQGVGLGGEMVNRVERAVGAGGDLEW
ncbi:N-terminal nucleophile aminohydrolase [Gonapodya prolifera JEL478]|uniref:N-terminal nucleophile aminohydrolase n=1 Tax=Gonapodya prolifera (strain JEL478) TaxID=1344416 RepID=A0A139AV67_GONPJ|nr:N-terminal nucleophile aminohydrolase [Gonapodya prolifera JEL478]|eukprot:KXS20594.1 N-terminal nucleophile aminohydrolase [Gonapodya prolifera JEL478]